MSAENGPTNLSISNFVLFFSFSFCSIAERKHFSFSLKAFMLNTRTRAHAFCWNVIFFSSPSSRWCRVVFYPVSNKIQKWYMNYTKNEVEKKETNQTFTALLFDAFISSARLGDKLLFCFCVHVHVHVHYVVNAFMHFPLDLLLDILAVSFSAWFVHLNIY